MLVDRVHSNPVFHHIVRVDMFVNQRNFIQNGCGGTVTFNDPWGRSQQTRFTEVSWYRTNTHIYITGLLIECTGADGPRQCWIPALPVQSATQVRVHKKSRALISIMSDSFVCPAMMLTEEVEESVFPRVEIALIWLLSPRLLNTLRRGP